MNRALRPRLASVLLLSAAIGVATALVPGTAARAAAAERSVAAPYGADDCGVSVSGNQDTFSTYTARVTSDPCNLQVRAYAHCSVYVYPSTVYYVDNEGPTINREGNSVAQCDQVSVGGGYDVNINGSWVRHQIS